MACVQIYEACKERGRIAYKRSGGSRLITHNEHWKSQIRHALYTSDRFVRCGAECKISAGLLAWAFWAGLRTCSFLVQEESRAARWSMCVLWAGPHARGALKHTAACGTLMQAA